MKLEYIVKCKYYGESKTYNKTFYSDKQYYNFKEWIKHKKGYTNVQFLKKQVTDIKPKITQLDLKIENRNKKEKLTEFLLSTKKPVLFYKFVYCLIKDDEVVYIGKTINIQGRILQHKINNSKDFDSFSIVAKFPNEITDKELLEQEEKYIKLLKPKYNITHNKVIN